MSVSEIEKREFYEIDSTLPALWNEGLLTDTDCRIIVSSNTLVEKKAAVYSVILLKTKQDAAVLTDAFRHANENSTNVQCTSSDEENHSSDLLPRNPFLNNMIIKHLFGFLPFKDMKRSRLVCQKWNSTGEICLRKRSTIHFRPKVIHPRSFMEFSKYSHPDLLFSSFAFSSDDNSSWDVTDIQNFLEKWDKNIKEVTFKSFELRQSNVLFSYYENYDVTALFINPSNIKSLKIDCSSPYRWSASLHLSLEKFVSLKTVYLESCKIIVSAENQNTRIAPIDITLKNVSFIRNGEIVKRFCYNDIFDFSKALNILLFSYTDNAMDRILDMGMNVFNANKLAICNIYLQNLDQAKGVVQSLQLIQTNFVEQNQLVIKQLFLLDSKIDLNALPQSLMYFDYGRPKFFCSGQLHLPNLTSMNVVVEDFDSLLYFSNCANLVELTIREIGTLSLGCVPKSVKRMLIDMPDIEFADQYIFEVDTLVLEALGSEVPGVTSFTTITAHIKAKVLVVICGVCIFDTIDTSDIVKLVLANKQAQKILFGSDADLHDQTPFEGSELSKYVDKESNFYQFENGVGKSITQEEFVSYANESANFQLYRVGNCDCMEHIQLHP